MSARDAILAAVRQAMPSPLPLPDVATASETFRSNDSSAERMMRVALAGGSTVLRTSRTNVATAIANTYPNARRTLSVYDSFKGNSSFGADPHELDNLDLFVCEGILGVAEDGGVWLTGDHLQQRAALFLATNVVIVLDESKIVATLHDAYAHIDVRAPGYGVFVSGPSKTADIEQSLVIGAHGPMSLTLVLVS